MDDSLFNTKFNYDNCIITTHGDSDTSSEFSLNWENETVEHCRQCETIINEGDGCNDETSMTCEQLDNVTLEADEVFTFILGVATKVERVLGKLEENDIKEWLDYQIKLLKTVLLRNCSVFNVGVENISGSVYIKDIETKEPVKEMKKKLKQNKKRPQKVGKKKQDQADKKRRNSKVEKQLVTNHSDGKSLRAGKLESTPKLNNRRYSERLENLKDREDIFCDKLTYTSLKVPLSSSTPVTRILTKKEYEKICKEKKRKQLLKAKKKGSATFSTKSSMESNKISNLGEQKKSHADKNRPETSSQKQTDKKKRNSGLKSNIQSASFDAATQNKKNKCVTNRNVKSFCVVNSNEVVSPSKKPKEKKERTQSKKRQSVDLDYGQARKAKIAKREVKSFSFPTSLSSSPSSSTKRKLYSATSWLDILPDVVQTTLP